MSVTEYLSPTPLGVLTPTPGHLADILHVELATGARSGTTYGTDTYGSWDYGGKQAWARWDCDITSVSMFRGRQTKLERNSPGVCYFTAVQIVPAGWLTTPPTARPARLVTSTNRVVFYGYIETANLNREYGTAEWQVTIVDDLARLGRLEIGTLVRPVEYAADRVDALLIAAGMLPQTDPYKATHTRVQAVNGSGRKVLDEIGIAVDTWRSTFTSTYYPAAALVDRTGWFTTRMAQGPPVTAHQPPGYTERLQAYYPWRISPTTGIHADNDQTWLGDAMHAEFSADLADLRNYLTLSSAGGTAQVFQDAASVTAYGPRSYQRMDLIAPPAEGGWSDSAELANTRWSNMAMEPTPRTRLKTISVDCWNRPAGGVPLVDILANIDISHQIDVALPDQDDAGGDIQLDVLPIYSPAQNPNSNGYIFGLSWELTDRSATLTLTLDAPIKIV